MKCSRFRCRHEADDGYRTCSRCREQNTAACRRWRRLRLTAEQKAKKAAWLREWRARQRPADDQG